MLLILTPFIWYFTLDDKDMKREIDAYLMASGVFLVILVGGILLLKLLNVKNLFKRIIYSFLAALISGIFTHAMISPTISLYVDDLIYKAEAMTAGKTPPAKFIGRYWEHGYYNKPFSLSKEGEAYILRSELHPVLSFARG
ncbi:hypothetical protein SAMN05428949_1233 [Chitinophaga sp. YR627]|nr:hypothetical protein SAMN05428949_1233 [Chitinophaga sp. YR627]